MKLRKIDKLALTEASKCHHICRNDCIFKNYKEAKEVTEKLVELGGAYYCFCDKERLQSIVDENGLHTYDKHCRNIPLFQQQTRVRCEIVVVKSLPQKGRYTNKKSIK